MQKFLEFITKACLFLLIGIGMQLFFWGATTYETVDFSTFKWYNWILQVIYVIMLITFAACTTYEDD